VFVKSGKVLVFGISKLTGDTSMVELVAGEKGIYNGKAEKVSKVDIASENELFWMTKTLSFDKTELAEVIEVLQKNYNVEFEFKNDILKSLRLSATFSNQPIESVIEVISTTLNLKITKSNSIYEIDGEGN
jgi:ferric-dicitrate binding protein FerR (iron transport regulator)